jgi:hypothetical protein
MSPGTRYKAFIYTAEMMITDRIPVGYFFAPTFAQNLYFANYITIGSNGKKKSS